MLYDKDIREPLFEFLEETYGKMRIIEEKQVGRSRADIVMVLPGRLTGIEIKSDADTYVRLERQVRDYDRYFDQNIVVAGSTHGAHVQEHVPEWWGIITVEQTQEGIDFYIRREAGKNPQMNWKRKLSLLWRPELVHIQELTQMPRYKEKSKAFVIEKMIQKVPEEQRSLLVSEELFERDYTRIEAVIREYKSQNRPASEKGTVGKRRARRRRRGSRSGMM